MGPGSAKGRRYRHWTRADGQRWTNAFKRGKPIIDIATEEKVDSKIVSKWLRRLGVRVYSGFHRVQQPPLKYQQQLLDLVRQGPDAVLKYLGERVWGLGATETGVEQLNKFCQFVRLHHQGAGVVEAAQKLGVHRSTVAEWREGTDQPYTIRAANETLPMVPRAGWKLLPLHLISGGSEPRGWIQVPETIQSYTDVLDVTTQLQPLEKTYERAARFELPRLQVDAIRPELSACLLGMMAGDATKAGGSLNRYASMNLDLQLTKKQPTNKKLGDFVCMCANALGIIMERRQDKEPSGSTRFSRQPSAAYRWTSERSPILAWMFSGGLGLRWGESTSVNQLRMNWIFNMPEPFRIRFVQGIADSDGTVKPSEVVITSVPNADFVTRLLQSLGMTTAHTLYERNKPLRTMVNARQSAKLPIFNEYVRSYRYQKLRRFM